MRILNSWIVGSLIVLFALLATGCEATVKATVLDGVETGAQTIVAAMVSALFQSLGSSAL
jgi:putative exporter of polyketide antibiotics